MVECLNEVVGAVERLNGRQVHRRRDFSRFLIVLADALTCFKTPLKSFQILSSLLKTLRHIFTIFTRLLEDSC